MFILGITGNSGSGKSTACEILKNHGAYIIDADLIAKTALEKGRTPYNNTIELFGEEILFPNGEINRKALSDIVFNDKEKLEELNRITHEYVISCMKNEIQKAKSDYEFICLDVPLLFESGTDSMCDSTWLIDANYETKINRIIKRDNLTAKQAELRLKNQTKSQKLRELATDIIENNGEINELEEIIRIKLSLYINQRGN